MNGLCKDCKWWDGAEIEELPSDFGVCGLATGAWILPETQVVVLPQYGAQLHTKPDFGCNQWASSRPEKG